jgi:hypothetical protein
MNHKTYHHTLILVSALATFLVTGCTHMIRPPKEPFTAYTGQEKIHLKVGVNLTDELLQAKGETHSMGDTWVIPIGGSIATNACVLARHTFDEVVNMSNSQLPPNETVTAILTPKVAYANRTMGATSFGKSIVDIKVEWTLSDLSGNTIWVDTIDGQSSGSTGWTSATKVLKRALEDLLTKSQQAISSAPAIRQYAQKQSP